MFFQCIPDDIPSKVSINEAIDLGKKFGNKSSAPFINGVPDEISLPLSKKNPPRRQEPILTEGENL